MFIFYQEESEMEVQGIISMDSRLRGNDNGVWWCEIATAEYSLAMTMIDMDSRLRGNDKGSGGRSPHSPPKAGGSR